MPNASSGHVRAPRAPAGAIMRAKAIKPVVAPQKPPSPRTMTATLLTPSSALETKVAPRPLTPKQVVEMPAVEEDDTSEVDDETLMRLEQMDVGLPPAPPAKQEASGGLPSLDVLRAGLAAALTDDAKK